MKIVYTILYMINHTKEKWLRKKHLLYISIKYYVHSTKIIFLQIYNVLKENILHI